MLALFKDVVKPIRRGKATLKPKMFNLGGTSCIFKKAIAPLARYEISSRVLCWDHKWIYVVSHFTKPGSNKATQYLLGSRSKGPLSGPREAENQQADIYATAISKFVFKQGRVTCTPMDVMTECGLLPTQPTTEGPQGLTLGIANTKKAHDEHWSLEQVLEESNKHLTVAQSFGSLDQLHETFIGRSRHAMYAY